MMKIINNNILKLTALVLSFSMSGCSKYLDVNETPNNPLKVPAATLLPAALAGTAFANSNELNRFTSTIMSVTAGASNAPERYDIYIVTGDDFGNQWNGELYGGALVNYNKLIEAASANNGPAMVGIGKIMKAYTFSMVTDIWGDIPYSEALQGDMGLVSPKLDSQKDIYLGNKTAGIESLFDLVRSGLADLEKESPLKPGVEDIVYGGNIENWKRAGNSLLLKLAMQISAVEPAQSKAILQEVITKNQFIQSNAANLSVRFGSQVGSQAPIWTYTHNSLFQNDLIISTRFITLLSDKKDPRLEKFVTKPKGEYITIDNGFGGTKPPFADRSKFNAYVTGQTGEGPTRLLTYAQTSFIIAEAIVRHGIAGNAQNYYQQGIRASMQDAGVSSADIDAYFAANAAEVSLTGSNNEQIRKIITQKYISLYSNGIEQWNDWRRTGFPLLAEHQNAAGADGKRPVRAVYLFSEQQRNPNFPQGDKVPESNERVWWDVN